MKELEAKNQFALATAKLLFGKGLDLVFIGGTALNAFYLNYRYSEDLDLAYFKKEKRDEVVIFLIEQGYVVNREEQNFRYTISFQGSTIKMDILHYEEKYNGTDGKELDGILVKTLKIEEFFVEKLISFFTREDRIGLGRDAYDLFSIEQKYHFTLELTKKAKTNIKNNIVSLDHNLGVLEANKKQIEDAMTPYLRNQIKIDLVIRFIKKLQGALK
ncbi:MAG: nucleotidyl transferase AbiEii/AbiGii toxin family protein [Candidatus Micrarchaeota archaeon]